ncbi:MAG TPA: hypothetical protein VK843_12275 [Planctomycetota bacterium]|nr:hypothetical protein [Planctomycetota bacterium]
MFGLSAFEIIVIVVVAILVFGERLPQVAAEFAGWLMKLRRSLTDLRRESGIDREISEVRRQVENAVPREVRSFNVERSVQKSVQTIQQEVISPVVKEFDSARAAAAPERSGSPIDRRESTGSEGQSAENDEPARITPARTDPTVPPAATDPLP